jgi:hypothetical protein
VDDGWRTNFMKIPANYFSVENGKDFQMLFKKEHRMLH